MSRPIFRSSGGTLALPDRTLVLVDRQDGGNLIVTPPKDVWERSELSRDELVEWSLLVAASGRAMLDVLPQLEGGCINYWEAGNWALNERADPPGPKDPREHRRVHVHLLGRSRSAFSSWPWGEAPVVPAFTNRHAWARSFRRLTAAECRSIVARLETTLVESYGVPRDVVGPSPTCPRCGYPTPAESNAPPACADCV